jgi:DNA-directed RNA polymerase subunit RPC12/RpoP
MNKLELTSLNCASCGASISDFQGKNQVKCEYCNTTIKVLRPKPVQIIRGGLSQEKYDTLNNYVEILQKAIRAGNYNEGYDYCNKALEIDPNIGAIWENKAICAFWRSVSFLNEDKITNTNAREIKTFLNASKENDPNSETYNDTANSIGYNLFIACKVKLMAIRPDTHELDAINKHKIPAFSKSACIRIKDFLETMETSYEIMSNPDVIILKELVKAYSNKIPFIKLLTCQTFRSAKDIYNWQNSGMAKLGNIDALKKRQILIKRIKSLNPSYNEPELKKVGCFIATAALGDYNHPVVMDLRMFRDNWLLKRKWGVIFTNSYYTHGPKVASVIEKSFFLKRLTFITIVKPLQIITKNLR